MCTVGLADILTFGNYNASVLSKLAAVAKTGLVNDTRNRLATRRSNL